MPQVLNKNTQKQIVQEKLASGEAVYVGRPSKYGNPFVIGKDGTREEVLEKYRKYIYSNQQLLDEIQSELVGKDLVCFCAPLPCHANILLRIANGHVWRKKQQEAVFDMITGKSIYEDIFLSNCEDED